MAAQHPTAKEVINFLSQSDNVGELVLAPGAPPVFRGVGTMRIAMNHLMTATEIADVIMVFKSYGGVTELPAKRSAGHFSFPVPQVGRFRVAYLQQRGSFVLSITKMSFQVPDLEAVCTQPHEALEICDLVRNGFVRLVSIHGPSATANATFVIAMLERINTSPDTHRLICTVEHSLYYLMKHHNCIMVQCESDTDVNSIEEGVRNVLSLNPDILFVGDVGNTAELTSLGIAIGRGVTTLVSSSVIRCNPLGHQLMRLAQWKPSATLEREWIPLSVTPGSNGKIQVNIEPRDVI